MSKYWDDSEYEEYTIEAVTEYEGGYDLRFDGSTGIGLPKQCDDDPPHGIVPKVGDALRLWGRGFGYVVRGMAINGQIAYYRTEQEQDDYHARQVVMADAKRMADFEQKGRAELDAKYAALPPIFQERIDRFRANNPEFRWKYEGYEMFCCTEAVKLARHLGTVEEMERYAKLATSATYSADKGRWDREFEEQKAIDKAAGLEEGHSGNTHGATVMLALLYLRQPDDVKRMHGALAPLVGSEEYGCVPRS